MILHLIFAVLYPILGTALAMAALYWVALLANSFDGELFLVGGTLLIVAVWAMRRGLAILKRNL